MIKQHFKHNDKSFLVYKETPKFAPTNKMSKMYQKDRKEAKIMTELNIMRLEEMKIGRVYEKTTNQFGQTQIRHLKSTSNLTPDFD